MTAGSELLIVGSVERDREGLKHFFEEAGYVCTATDEVDTAQDLVTKKFFPVALVDMDLEEQGSALSLVRFLRHHSPATAVILLVGQPDFKAATAALRAGVHDIVLKSPTTIDELQRRVALLSEHFQIQAGSTPLYREIRELMDASLKIMLEQAHSVYGHLSSAQDPDRPRVLIVEGDTEVLSELTELVEQFDWEVITEMSGGAGLDRAGSERFHVIAVRQELPDLLGTMVARSILTQQPEAVAVLYSAEGAGWIQRVHPGESDGADQQVFDGPEHLVERIQGLALELATRAQERRFMQAFRADHAGFLRRYAELKLKIDRLIDE